MPKLRFVRTPTEAEGGPENKFKEGEVYDVNPKSYRRWLDVGCAVSVAEWKEVKGEEKEEKEEKEEEVEIVEAGGQAPPIVVPKTVTPRPVVRNVVPPRTQPVTASSTLKPETKPETKPNDSE